MLPLNRFVASVILATSIAPFILATATPARAETLAQCNATAYRDYDYAVRAGASKAAAHEVLLDDLERCAREH